MGLAVRFDLRPIGALHYPNAAPYQTRQCGRGRVIGTGCTAVDGANFAGARHERERIRISLAVGLDLRFAVANEKWT